MSTKINKIAPISKEIQISNLISYLPDFNLILCLECKACTISPISHFNTIHSFKKQDINNKIKDLPYLIDINKVNIPKNKPIFYKSLPILDGFSCLKCSYLTTSYKSLRKHLNNTHSLKNIYKNLDLTDFYSNIKLQNLFSGTRYSKLYIINNPISKTSNTKDIIASFTKDINSLSTILPDKENIKERESIYYLNRPYFNKFKDFITIEYLNYINRPILEIDKNPNFLLLNSIYTITYNLLEETNILIPNLNTRLLQQLNSDIDFNFKDITIKKSFISLFNKSKPKYYSTFSRFIIYLIRIYLELNYTISYPKYSKEIVKYIEKIINTTKIFNFNLNSNKLANKIKKYITLLLFTILNNSIKQKSFSYSSLLDSPLITFLITLNITNKLEFKEIGNLQHYTTYLIYTIRLLFLNYLKILEYKINKKKEEFNLNTIFYSYYNKLLTNKSNNSFEELIRLRSTSRKVTINTSKEGRIEKKDNNTFLIDNKEIKLDKLKDFFSYIINKVEDLLYTKLLLKEDIIDFSIINSILDNPSITTPNYYFLNYKEKGQNLEEINTIFINKLLSPTSKLNKIFIKEIKKDNTIIFNINKVKEYLNNRKDFIKYLALAIYLTSGAPLRGEELLLIKYKNIENSPRNIYIEPKKNLIRINTRWHKGQNITRIGAINSRYLSPKLSKLIKIYLIYIIPFYNFLSIKALKNTIISPYLLENNNSLLESSTISSFLAKETKLFLKESLSFNPYRQLIEYIIYSIIKIKPISLKDSSSSYTIANLQSNNTPHILALNYGRSKSLNRGLTQNLETEFYLFSKEYQRFFNINKDNSPTSLSIIKGKNKEIIVSSSNNSNSISLSLNKSLSNSILSENNSILSENNSILSENNSILSENNSILSENNSNLSKNSSTSLKKSNILISSPKKHARNKSSITTINNPSKKTRKVSPIINIKQKYKYNKKRVSLDLNSSSSFISNYPSSPPIYNYSPERPSTPIIASSSNLLNNKENSLLTSPINKLNFNNRFLFIEDLEKENKENSFYTNLILKLNKLKNICLFCLYNKENTYNKHSIFRCNKAKILKESIDSLENYIKLNNLVPKEYCSSCFLPNNRCIKQENKCYYKKVALVSSFIARNLEYTNKYSFSIFNKDPNTYLELENFSTTLTTIKDNKLTILLLILELNIDILSSF
jgi:hypothetical protein